MIKKSKWKQFGIPRTYQDIKCIVIHNTSNYDKSARELLDYLNNESEDSSACHYLIDHNEIVEVMPLDWVAWNTGCGYDYGNMNGIAIEICSNRDTDTYLLGQEKAINLIKGLMKQYHLTRNDIYFHNDFMKGYNCPSFILEYYGNKKNFLDTFINEGEQL